MRKVSTKKPIEMEMSAPAIDPEARTNQLISLATNVAEQQMRDGTASSQVITHYLKLGAEREKARVELEILKAQRELVVAKTEAIQTQRKIEELYGNAIAAFTEYRGEDSDEDSGEEYYDV